MVPFYTLGLSDRHIAMKLNINNTAFFVKNTFSMAHRLSSFSKSSSFFKSSLGDET